MAPIQSLIDSVVSLLHRDQRIARAGMTTGFLYNPKTFRYQKERGNS